MLLWLLRGAYSALLLATAGFAFAFFYNDENGTLWAGLVRPAPSCSSAG